MDYDADCESRLDFETKPHRASDKELLVYGVRNEIYPYVKNDGYVHQFDLL